MAFDETPVEFGQLLAALMRSIREERGLSQEALAVQLGHDQPWISKVENGSRRVQLAEFLAWLDELGVALSDVAERVDDLWKSCHGAGHPAGVER